MAKAYGRAASGRTRRFRTEGNPIEFAEDLMSTGKRLRNWYQDKTRWTISVSSDDRLYEIALRWITSDEANDTPPRVVRAAYRHVNGGRFNRIVVAGEEAPSALYLFYDESGDRKVSIDGHPVTITLSKADQPERTDSGFRSVQPDILFFHARSREGRAAVANFLSSIATDSEKRKPALHLLSSWGDWTRRDDLPERQLSSVVLSEGQMDRLVSDVQGFLDAEADYNRRGMPYHRGYLLYGPPGTGKTSIVRALAAHFGLDLWYAPLGDMQKDASLINLVNEVKPGSILLLEDIDVYHSSRERADDEGLSMAGLLNALDGVATPHGLITFITTNHIEVLDDALLRSGRIDVQEEVGLPNAEQVARLYENWYGMKLTDYDIKKIRFTGSTSDATELFKRHLNDGASAWKVLQQG